MFKNTPYIPIISNPSYLLARELGDYIWLEQRDTEVIVELYEFIVAIKQEINLQINPGRLHNIDQNVIVFDLRPAIAKDRRIQVVYIPGDREFHVSIGFINRPEQLSNKYIGKELSPGSVGIFHLALVIIDELLGRGERVAIEASSRRKFKAYERHFKRYYIDYLKSGQLILRFIE